MDAISKNFIASFHFFDATWIVLTDPLQQARADGEDADEHGQGQDAAEQEQPVEEALGAAHAERACSRVVHDDTPEHDHNEEAVDAEPAPSDEVVVQRLDGKAVGRKRGGGGGRRRGAVAAPPRKFQFHGATPSTRQRAEMTHRVMKLCSIYAYSIASSTDRDRLR